MQQVNRCTLAPHHCRTLRGSGVLLGLGIAAGNCLGSFHPNAQRGAAAGCEKGRLLVVHHCAPELAVPCARMSHGLDEHPWKSPGQLWLVVMCTARQAVLVVGGILNFSQERGGLVT